MHTFAISADAQAVRDDLVLTPLQDISACKARQYPP
jgi:hypothetical protein